MNSRKYPRTMHEAFPRTAEYGCAITGPEPRFWTPIRVALAVTYFAAIVVLVFVI